MHGSYQKQVAVWFQASKRSASMPYRPIPFFCDRDKRMTVAVVDAGAAAKESQAPKTSPNKMVNFYATGYVDFVLGLFTFICDEWWQMRVQSQLWTKKKNRNTVRCHFGYNDLLEMNESPTHRCIHNVWVLWMSTDSGEYASRMSQFAWHPTYRLHWFFIQFRNYTWCFFYLPRSNGVIKFTVCLSKLMNKFEWYFVQERRCCPDIASTIFVAIAPGVGPYRGVENVPWGAIVSVFHCIVWLVCLCCCASKTQISGYATDSISLRISGPKNLNFPCLLYLSR